MPGYSDTKNPAKARFSGLLAAYAGPATSRKFTGASPVPRNYYSEINLHIVWHTKGSMRLLTPEVEAVAYRSLRSRIIETDGVFVHEIGGIADHVHLCLTVPPIHSISTLIGQWKGGSAHDVNQRLGSGRKVLQWQAGYGVVSFGTRDLPWVQAYVVNQATHHQQGTTHARLERITTEGESIG